MGEAADAQVWVFHVEHVGRRKVLYRTARTALPGREILPVQRRERSRRWNPHEGWGHPPEERAPRFGVFHVEHKGSSGHPPSPTDPTRIRPGEVRTPDTWKLLHWEMFHVEPRGRSAGRRRRHVRPRCMRGSREADAHPRPGRCTALPVFHVEQFRLRRAIGRHSAESDPIRFRKR